MLNNVKDFGAVGDGIHDDRAAIQAAIDDAVANDNKAGILFPAGTYRVSLSTDPQHKVCSLDLNGVQDFMVMGEGPSSIVKLVDTTDPSGTADWHVFRLRNNSQRVVFKDLVIDGNRTGLTNPNEQSHGIEVEETTDLVIDRCIIRECFGDGVRLLGKPPHGSSLHVRRVRIENCLFQTNKRSGLGIQRAIEQISVINCFFDATVSDQSIDFEPSGSEAPTDIVIQGCIINHTNRTPAVGFQGIRGPEPLLRCKFTDNIVVGGEVFCTDVDQLTIQNNIIRVPDTGTGTRVPVQVQRGGDSVIISGNLLVNDTAGDAVIAVREVNHRQVTRALITNNLCFARSGNGIVCQSGDDIAIQGNMVVATGPCKQGIKVDSEGSDVDNVSVRDNDIMAKGTGTWEIGILVNSKVPHHVHHVSVVGNSVRSATKGVSFTGAGFTRTPVCALNRIDVGVTTPFTGLSTLPERSLVVGGATSIGGTTAGSGAGRLITGLGDPNTVVTGNVGDLFQRLDGGARSTLYVKEADANPKTGWTAK